MGELKEKDLIEDIGNMLDRIFMERRMAKDLDFDVEKIDKFIVEEGSRLKQKYDELTTQEMVDIMLSEILSYFE